MLRDGVEYVSVPGNPVEHGRRHQLHLAHHVLTESIFSWTDQPEKKLFCRGENAQAPTPPKAAHQIAAGANTLHGRPPHTPVDSSTLRFLECTPGANAPVEATGGHLPQA